MKGRFLMLPALFLALAALFPYYADAAGKTRRTTVHIYEIGDVHGCYFDSLYMEKRSRPSLFAVSRYINDRRVEFGKDKVVLLDLGDGIQGDNASYYYNNVAKDEAHVYSLMANYMGVDAVIVGNHDIEAGPAVYDRLKKQFKMPYLAANALDKGSGKCHFARYTVLRKAGLKIAVIGLTNSYIGNWLDESQMGGMNFVNPVGGFIQGIVDNVRRSKHPDMVVVAIHSGTGDDAATLECQGVELQKMLRGVDLVICAHDHRATVVEGTPAILNAGSHCRNIGHCFINVTRKGKRVLAKEYGYENIPVDSSAIDKEMAAKFRPQYCAVRDFSNSHVGSLAMPLVSRDAYVGQCDLLNFLHTVCLKESGADISFAAPLKFNSYVRKGKVAFDDLFSIYHYENKLCTVMMTGTEVRAYLEASYDGWTDTVSPGQPHLLRIRNAPDQRTGQTGWSFVNRSYNFDSAGGINYTVDVTAPKGSRVKIHSMADGRPFLDAATYMVAVTSYRANGGGHLMQDAGIADPKSRIVWKGGDIRNIIHDYFKKYGEITPSLVGDASVIGSWRFVPEDVAEQAGHDDMKLLFPEYVK